MVRYYVFVDFPLEWNPDNVGADAVEKVAQKLRNIRIFCITWGRAEDNYTNLWGWNMILTIAAECSMVLRFTSVKE